MFDLVERIRSSLIIDELIHEFDVDESDGIEIFEFISMIQKFQQDFQLDPTDELIEALQ